MRIRPQRSLTRLAFALSLLPLLSLAPAKAQGPPPTPVRVDAARTERLQEFRRVSGELRPRHQSLVASAESGRVIEMLVREGQAVEVGAPLARLDATRLELELATLEAELAVANANLAEREYALGQAERDRDTVRGLAERDAANPKELADAESDVLAAGARKEQATQAIEVIGARKSLLEDRRRKQTVSAPFAGVVIARHTDLGEWLQVGAPVVELSSAGELEAWLEVPQEHHAALQEKPGAIRVRVAWGGEWLIEDYRSVARIDPRARTFAVIANMPGGLPLAPGMSVSAEIPTAVEQDHLTISHAGILRNEVGPYVYAAFPGGPDEPMRAMPVPIDILFRTRERAVIRAGALPPGSQVIVEGNERLYPTAAVRILNTEAPEEGSR